MKKTCEFCCGSGQTSHFLGVSRFLLSQEECPQCAGMGFTIASKTAAGKDRAGAETPFPGEAGSNNKGEA